MSGLKPGISILFILFILFILKSWLILVRNLCVTCYVNELRFHF